MQPAQSTSVKKRNKVDDDFFRRSPVVAVPLMNRRMRLTASQCTSVGLERN
jgi:hypothetical protein